MDQPRLLARASQYGYITINQRNPDLSRAMIHEPEPITPNQLEDLKYRESIRRQQQYAAAKASMIADLERLGQDAGVRERRKLQNAQRAIKSL